MASKRGITRRDVGFCLASIALVVVNLAAIGTSGRERAKRAVCLANLRQLTSAWNLYADENDGKIVNGEVDAAVDGRAIRPVSGRHKGEQWWVGKDWASTYMTEGCLPADVQVQAIKAGALFSYCGNERLYHCPSGVTGEVRGFAIVDAMNGMYRSGTSSGNTGVRVGPTVLWVKKKTEITVPGPTERLVLVEERATPDSYAVHYMAPRWWDPPTIRHEGGTNVAFVDGHSTHWKWWAAETVQNATAKYPLYQYQPVTPEGKRDLQRMQTAVWGRIGYK